MQVRTQAAGQLLSASSQQCADEKIAKQQAALGLVHQLQHAILEMFTTSQPELAVFSQQAQKAKLQEGDLKILYDGDRENSTPEVGHVVKMQYELVLDSSNNSAPGTISRALSSSHNDSQQQDKECAAEPMGPHDDAATAEVQDGLLEHSNMLRFEYGGGGVIPELEHAGRHCTVCRREAEFICKRLWQHALANTDT